MAKKEKESLVALEIDKYEKKINEFQVYLETHDIRRIGELDEEGKKYKEIDIQIKMMTALPAWIGALKQLKQQEENAPESLRGDSEINDAAAIMMRK